MFLQNNRTQNFSQAVPRINTTMKLLSRISILLFLIHPLNVKSQALTVSTTQLNFGTAYENAPDSLQLTLQNQLSRTVTVTNMKFYTTYGAPAFSTLYSNFQITAGSSITVWIKFSPRHNIYHNSELVIENDGLRGYPSVDLIGQGRYSNTYYAASENQEEENLKAALHTLTGVGYVTLGYNDGRDKMFMLIDNKRVNGQGASQNTIESIYTGQLAVGYTDRTDCQTTFNFNTEHTWPQSLFNSLDPMVSDLHHLFPTDDNSNGERGNNPFGVVSNPSWSVGGSKSNNSEFEPRDQQKGQTARAMIYFVLRYQNYNNFFTSQESVLRTWHQNFPPTDVEKNRNEDINTYQHNRNPFVDYPQFLERIQSLSSTSISPVIDAADFPIDTIIYGYIPASQATLFHYVIVNTGNTVVNLSNFNLSNPGVLSFQSGGSATSLNPGEALGIDIACAPSTTTALHEFLTYTTDISGHTSVSVPIYANDSVFDNVSETTELISEFYPNPVHDILVLKFKNTSANAIASVHNLLGQNVMNDVHADGQAQLSLNLENLQPGVYVVSLSASGLKQEKLVLKY